MEEALDWVAQTGRDEYAFVEEGRVAVAGQSCGGVEAYQVAGDERVGALGVFNSGLLSVAEAERLVPGIGGKPVFYFLGGEGDVAFVNVSCLVFLFLFVSLRVECGGGGQWLTLMLRRARGIMTCSRRERRRGRGIWMLVMAGLTGRRMLASSESLRCTSLTGCSGATRRLRPSLLAAGPRRLDGLSSPRTWTPST